METTNMTDPKHEIAIFVAEHSADDIVYALANPKYYSLTDAELLELYAFVFRAIDEAKK